VISRPHTSDCDGDHILYIEIQYVIFIIIVVRYAHTGLDTEGEREKECVKERWTESG